MFVGTADPIKSPNVTVSQEIFQVLEVQQNGVPLAYLLKGNNGLEQISKASYNDLENDWTNAYYNPAAPNLPFADDGPLGFNNNPPWPNYQWTDHTVTYWDAPGAVGTVNNQQIGIGVNPAKSKGVTIVQSIFVIVKATDKAATASAYLAVWSQFSCDGTTWT